MIVYGFVIVFTFRYIMNRSRYIIVAFTAVLSMAVLLPQLCHALNPEERRKLFDMEANYKKCAEKPLIFLQIKCLIPIDQVAYAYADLYTPLFDRKIDPELGLQRLKLQGLYQPAEKNQEYIRYLKLMGIDNDEFYTLFEDAIEWGIAERTKSAEELYNRSHSLPSDIRDDLLSQYKLHYLRISKNKGHKKAEEEHDRFVRALADEFDKKYGR